MLIVFADTYKTSFFVQASSSSHSLKFLMLFDNVIINDGGGFDYISRVNFLSPQAGIYWFVYTVIWNGATEANITMLGTNQTLSPQAVRLHKRFWNDDVLSSSSILTLTNGQNLSMFSVYHTKATTETGSSWGAFIIDSLMSPLVLFEVIGLRLNAVSKATYTIISVDEGNGWSYNDNNFVAKTTGVYYFSATIFINTLKKMQAYFSVNNSYFCTLVYFDTAFYEYIDTVSRGCLLSLQKNDKVTLTIDKRNYDAVKGAYLRGFFYSPRHDIKIAWSLHNDQNVSSFQNTTVEFNRVLLSPNNATWNSDSKILTISISGVYFIEIVGSSNNYSSFWEKNSIDMCLLLNSSSYLSILNFKSNAQGITRSRSVIVHLGIGDRVSVISLGDRTVHMSGYYYQGLSFQGFLLYPDS